MLKMIVRPALSNTLFSGLTIDIPFKGIIGFMLLFGTALIESGSHLIKELLLFVGDTF